MAINFANINLEVIDITTNATPDLFINQNAVTFSKRVLEDLGYPANVQYCTDAANKVFAVRVCKSNETKATAFSKAKSEQTTTLSVGNKNLREVLVAFIPNFDPKKRYLSMMVPSGWKAITRLQVEVSSSWSWEASKTTPGKASRPLLTA